MVSVYKFLLPSLVFLLKIIMGWGGGLMNKVLMVQESIVKATSTNCCNPCALGDRRLSQNHLEQAREH